MSTSFTEVYILIKLYHMGVDIPNTNETKYMSIYHKDVNIQNE